MIYSFYDPEHETRTGLGNFIILDHIRRAAREAVPYVYLGYWVEGSARMQYKIRYRPMERLGRSGWERIAAVEQDRLITESMHRLGRGSSPPGSTKDGMPGGQDQYRLVD